MELGNLTELSTLGIGRNQLTGCVPSSLDGQLTVSHTDLGGPRVLRGRDRPGLAHKPDGKRHGQTQIDLSWTAPSINGGAAITGYRIEASTNGSTWSDLVADTGSTTTSYSAHRPDGR